MMPGQASTSWSASFRRSRTARVGLLSFGFVLALYFTSNGMIAMMHAFDKSYVKTFKRRNVLKKRAIAATDGPHRRLFIAASVLVILGDVILKWDAHVTQITAPTTFLVNLLRWISMLALYYITIGCLYRYGAATRVKVQLLQSGRYAGHRAVTGHLRRL